MVELLLFAQAAALEQEMAAVAVAVPSAALVVAAAKCAPLVAGVVLVDIASTSVRIG